MLLPQSFRDLLELHERQLRDLVDGEGDAPERVWAAWVPAPRPAFALTYGSVARGTW